MRRRVLYVVGAGRSGTTLLDIVLGNQSNHISCGELNRFPQRNGLPPLAEDGSERAIFWAEVNQYLVREQADFIPANMAALERAYCYHTGALRHLIGFEGGEESVLYDQYVRSLYDAIFVCSGKEVIVDSSKYPGRALRVQRALKGSEVEPLFVYIRRDPAAVVASFAKRDIEQPSKSFVAANLYYAAVNFICLWTIMVLRRRGCRTVSISYEELVDSPKQCIERLESGLAEDLSGVLEAVAENRFNVGPLFDGNRIRLKTTLSLESAASSERTLSLKGRLSRLLNWPLTRP